MKVCYGRLVFVFDRPFANLKFKLSINQNRHQVIDVYDIMKLS